MNTYEEKVRKMSKKANKRIWKYLSEAELSTNESETAFALNMAHYWMGYDLALVQMAEAQKKCVIKEMTSAVWDLGGHLDQLLKKQEQEEEINPCSEKAKHIAMKIDDLRETIKALNNARSELRKSLKEGDPFRNIGF